ncbi:MAG TPA: sigma-70 family RNA polymerase sigma factor [Kofleriaceae bacterium]|nr:sigma-70 family RNA polymerase sigma factor [Kofleriaceae bacterium]
MAEPGGELETLWPRSDNGAGGRRGGGGLPRRARRLLFAGVVLVAIGALVQLLAIAWFELLKFLFRSSAEVLVHTGGLDRRTFAACSIAALVLDAVLLIAIATRSVRRSLRRTPPADPQFAGRHPLAASSAGLLLALAFVIAGGWRPSPYFPYPLATVVVLATGYWFGLLGVLAIARVADLVWRALRAWGIAARWRTGLLTASLALAAAACAGLLATRWYAGPLGAVEAGLALAPGHTGDVLASELDGLCLVADVLEPSLAHSSAAPACEFLTTESRPLDDCVAALIHDWVPDLRQQLRQRGLDPYDIDDVVMKALLATCTRPLPSRVPHAYLFAAAGHQATQIASAPRAARCDAAHPLAATCAAGEPAESRARKLAQLWDDALCRIGDDAAQILRRRLEQDETFREIGDHLRLPESDVRETYHHAIKQLRTPALASCDDP